MEVSQERLERLAGEVSELWATRRLEGGEGEDFGFPEEEDLSQKAILIEEASGAKTTLYLGMRNPANGQLYVRREEERAVYLTRTPVDKNFSGEKRRFARYEELPELSQAQIRSIKVTRERESYVLKIPGDDKATVEWEEKAQEDLEDGSRAGESAQTDPEASRQIETVVLEEPDFVRGRKADEDTKSATEASRHVET